jgi:hypothetical protein
MKLIAHRGLMFGSDKTNENAPYQIESALDKGFDAEIDFDRSPVQGRDRLRRAQEVSALIAVNFEKHIAAHPGNWHQLQPVWADLVASDVKSR